MNLDKVFNIAGSIVVLAAVSVVVSSPRTAGIISALGSSFATAINAATRPAR
jgi:hypothetical protein